jgi:hypothetical protein
MVEQLTLNQLVLGSSPSRGTTIKSGLPKGSSKTEKQLLILLFDTGVVANQSGFAFPLSRGRDVS